MGLVTLVCLLLAVLWEELAYIKSHLDLPSIWFLSHLVPQRSIEALYLCQNRHTRPITPLWNFQHSEKQPPTSMNVENYVFFYFSIKFLSNLGNVENSQAMAKWPKTLKIANLAINSQKWTHCHTLTHSMGLNGSIRTQVNLGNEQCCSLESYPRQLEEQRCSFVFSFK